MFSTYKYAHDPYRDKSAMGFSTDPKLMGKRGFLTCKGKKGRGPDSTFSRKTYKSDPYRDPYKLRTEQRQNERAAMVKAFDRPDFKPSSPSRSLAFSSTYLTHPEVHDPEWRKAMSVKLKEERDEANATSRMKALGEDNADGKLPTRPILTSPSKRGSYGVSQPGITFSKFSYATEDYDSQGRKEWERMQQMKRKVGDRPAFLSQSVNKETFDAMPHAAASKVFTRSDRALPPRPDPALGLTAKEWVAKQTADSVGPIERHAFRPSQPPKVGVNATFSPFPKRGVEPYDPTAIRRAQTIDRILPSSVRLKGVAPSLSERASWKAVSSDKTLPVRSTNKAVAKAGFLRSYVK